MITLRITWKYAIALYCITMLYASLHELAHHFAGFIVCGEWGYKTFNYFETACEGTSISYIANYAGPVFTFIMMWTGALFLIKKNASELTRQWAFAMIFAQLPLQRMICPFFRMNDEYYTTSLIFSDSNTVYWLVIIIIWLICLPPLIVAYRAIKNKNKFLWFMFFFTFFPYILWGPIFGGLEFLLVNKHVMDGTIFGIANLFILNEVITIVGYFATKKYFNVGK